MTAPESKFVVSAENRASGTLKKIERDFTSLSGAVGVSSSLLRASLAGISVGFLVKSFVEATDTFKRVDTQLRNATRSTLEFNEAQRRLFDIAQSTRQNYASLATTFAQISASAGTSIGTQDQQLKFFETVSKAIALSGSSAEASAAALMQFRQGLASGALRGEELNSIMEQTPRLARAIAEGLGVSIGQLREMGKAGELTAERIVDGMSKAAQSVDREFANVVPTFDSAMTQMGNSVGRLFDRIEKGTGGPVFELVAMLNWAAKKLDALTRDASLTERIAAQQKKLADAEAGPGASSWYAARERASLDALLVQSRGQFRAMENETSQVDLDRSTESSKRAAASWEVLGKKYATTAEKVAVMAKEIRAAGVAAGRSEAEIQRLIQKAATPAAGGAKKDPLADLIELATVRDKLRTARDKVLTEELKERAAVEVFFAQLLHDTGEKETELIADEVEANRARSDAWRDVLDPARKYALQLEEIARLTVLGASAGGLSESEGDRAWYLVRKELDNDLAGIAQETEKTNDIARDLGMTFTSAFESAISGGKSFSAVLKGLAQDIAMLMIRKNLTEPFLKLFGDLFTGGGGGGLNLGGSYLYGSAEALAINPFDRHAKGNVFDPQGLVPFADGGIVSRPTLFPFAKGVGLMGEAGPEAIMPLRRGRDGKLGVAGGGGQSVVITQHITVSGGTSKAELLSAMTMAKDAAKREILDSMKRGGAFA